MSYTRQFSRWLGNLFRPVRPIKRSIGLSLNLLEGREVPATFNVTNHFDTGVVGSLRWAISQANAATSQPNTITFSKSAIGQLNLTSSLPQITNQLTIDNNSGGAFTINGGSKYQIFVVGAPITLDKIVLTKGSATSGSGNGGAIDVTDAAAVTLNTCSVTLSRATNNGGGLFSSGGAVTVNHSTFTRDAAGNLGGGLMVEDANVTLTASNIVYNAALGGAGIDAITGDVRLLSGTRVEYNAARGPHDGGGGIAVSAGFVSAIGSFVIANTSKGTGGGVWVSGGNVSIEGKSYVDYNSAVSQTGAGGGGIWVRGGDVDVTGSVVDYNVARGGGGGIYAATGDVKISVSTVNYNKAAVGNGGGIWAFGNVVVAGDQTVGANKKVHTYFAGVSANSAYLNGGGIYSAQGTVSVSIGHVMSNVASYRNGGGIYESNGTAIVNAQGLVYGNRVSSGVGGGIFVATGNVTVAANGQVSANFSLNSGGGIYDQKGDVNVSGEVNWNVASRGNGGGIWAIGNVAVAGNQTVGANNEVHAYFATDSANSAYLSGGGIYSAGGTVTISIAHVVSNTARLRSGGGIYEVSGNVSVNSEGLVYANHASSGDGGGIFVASGNVTVAANGDVNANSARIDGGGIFDAKGNVNISGKVIENVAYDGRGGGIYVGVGAVNVLGGGEVDHNIAHVYHTHGTAGTGGGNGAGSSGGSSGSSGTGGFGSGSGGSGGGSGGGTGGDGGGGTRGGGGGTGGEGGGGTGGGGGGDSGGGGGGGTGGGSGGGGSGGGSAILAVKPAYKGIIMGGGGIYVSQGNVTVSGGQVMANSADYGTGGGICDLDGNVNLTAGAVVEGNYSRAKGGGIYDAAAASTMGVQITDATVSGNVAAISGGGVYVSTGTIGVLDSTIYKNHANRKSGGGLDDKDANGSVIVTNSTIGGNAAVSTGGGISSSGTATINNSTIVLNSISRFGAGAGVIATKTISIDNSIVAGNYYVATIAYEDISGSATGSNNVIGNAGTAGGLINGRNGNLVGLNGTGTRLVSTIIDTPIANHGGATATYSLAPGSVALGRGNSALNPASVGDYDQRGPGFPRTVNGSMDIGAVEDEP